MAMEGGDNASCRADNPTGTILDGDFSESDDGSDDNAELSCSAVFNTANTASLQVHLHGAMGLGQAGGNRSGHGPEHSRCGRACRGCDCGGCG